MFEDECQRASWRRHGAIACGVAKRGLVAFLAFAMAFGTTPAQLWAEGAEGIAEAVTQTAETKSAEEQAAGEGDADAAGTDAAASSGTVATSEQSSAPQPSAVQSAAGSSAVAVQSDDALTIFSLTFENLSTGEQSYAGYTTSDTILVHAFQKVNGARTEIDSSDLSYQWQEGPKQSRKDSDYTDIPGATEQTLKLAEYAGKSVRCVVTPKAGGDSYANRGTTLVTAADSVSVSSVTLDKSGKVYAGDVISATAKSGTTDVSADSRVSWQWYYGDSSSVSACTNKITGATSRTFTVTADLFGKYLVAKATSASGETTPDVAVGPVSEAGAVELYGVTVEGASSTGAVHVGNVLTAKATKGNSYTNVGSTDTVHYQWQYADAKSTSDAAFKNIDGAADSASYTVAADMVGKYIRVIATSENSVKSTQKKYYGSTTSVDPVGPVTLAGQYTLKSVEPAEASTATLNVGTTLTPKVRIPDSSSWSDSALPDDAKLTVTWYAKGADDANWTKVTDNLDASTGALTITDALVGKSLKLEASALDNTVTWTSRDTVLPVGEYNLLRVVSTPQLQSKSTNLVAGDSVSADVYAKRVDGSTTNGSTTNGVKLSADSADISWYAADASDAADDDWTKLEVTGAKIQVPDAAGNKYLKAVAASGSSEVEVVSANKVIKAGSLEAAVQKLSDKNALISVAYSADGGNVNDALKAQLEQLGFDDIDVKTKTASFSSSYEGAEVGISSTYDKTNGDVTFFYLDPNASSGCSIDQLRRASVTFVLSRDGKSVEYKPTKTVEIAWNEGKLQDLLDNAAEQLSIGYATGDTAESVTQNLTLPYRAGANKKFSVEWTSSDTDALSVSGNGWDDYTGKVARKSSDREVTLTAKVSVLSNVSDVKVTGGATHAVTVKGDPDKVASDKADLQAKVDAAFTYDNIKYYGTKTVADKDGLTADLQMPRTSTLGVDGKYYKVEYSASTDDITFNGYKGTVYQPLPGAEAAKTKVTLTVTDKSNAEVTASRTLDFAISPQNQDELNAELFHLSLAKSSFYLGILDGQNASSVTGNLHAPLKVYGQGLGVNWCYSTEEAAGHYGFVFSDLPGGTENTYRLLKSSKPRVIAHENLILTQPEYNTKVTISGRLKSERFARYAERYPDNSDYAVLAGLDVSATVNVKGTTGLDNPNEGKTITVTAKVTGVSASDADGNYTEQSVVPLTELTLPADDDTTAESVLEQLMTAGPMAACWAQRAPRRTASGRFT